MAQLLRGLGAAGAMAALWTVLGQPIGGQTPEMVELARGNPAHAEALLKAVSEGLPYVPGELLVRFKDGVGARDSGSALRVLRAPIDADNTEWIGEVLHLRGLDIEDPVHAAENLARQPEVLYAQPNYLNRVDALPNDPGYNQQWNMPLINMPQAWDINQSAGSGVIVAVVDSGLTTRDGTFGFPLWTGAGFAPFGRSLRQGRATSSIPASQVGVDLQTFGQWRTTDGQPVIFDAGGHGTHVAGTIAQHTNNSSGYAGVANGVTILPIKVVLSPVGCADVLQRPRRDRALPPPTTTGCEIASLVVAGVQVCRGQRCQGDQRQHRRLVAAAGGARRA